MRTLSLALVACGIALGTLAACGHDDFPDRLKVGCNSRRECNKLVAEATDRLSDCAGYMVGNRLTHDWQRAKTMCRREFADCDVAFDKANQWVRWANANHIDGKRWSYYRLTWQ
jgi:hypothetical protein